MKHICWCEQCSNYCVHSLKINYFACIESAEEVIMSLTHRFFSVSIFSTLSPVGKNLWVRTREGIIVNHSNTHLPIHPIANVLRFWKQLCFSQSILATQPQHNLNTTPTPTSTQPQPQPNLNPTQPNPNPTRVWHCKPSLF